MLAFENGKLVQRGIDLSESIHNVKENTVPVAEYHLSSRNGYSDMRVGSAVGRTVGIELELTFGDQRTANRATKEVSRAIIGAGIGEGQFSIERDGSLDYGFEVVMPYGEVTEYLSYLETMLKNPIFNHVDFSTGKAGLHVNVARETQTSSGFYYVLETLFSEVALTNSTYTSYSDHIATHFGLRVESTFAKLFPEEHIQTDIRRLELGYTPLEEKYRAINFRGSSASTVEFRLFNPTVNFSDMKTRVLLAHAAVEYATFYATFISSQYNLASVLVENLNMNSSTSWPLFYVWLKDKELYRTLAEKLVEDEDFVIAVESLTANHRAV